MCSGQVWQNLTSVLKYNFKGTQQTSTLIGFSVILTTVLMVEKSIHA